TTGAKRKRPLLVPSPVVAIGRVFGVVVVVGVAGTVVDCVVVVQPGPVRVVGARPVGGRPGVESVRVLDEAGVRVGVGGQVAGVPVVVGAGRPDGVVLGGRRRRQRQAQSDRRHRSQ